MPVTNFCPRSRSGSRPAARAGGGRIRSTREDGFGAEGRGEFAGMGPVGQRRRLRASSNGGRVVVSVAERQRGGRSLERQAKQARSTPRPRIGALTSCSRRHAASRMRGDRRRLRQR